MNKSTMQLPVKLTDEELQIRSRELAEKLTEIEAVDEDRASAMAAFKARKDKLVLDSRRLTRIVRTGQEEREVHVTETKNWERGTIETIRLDTGALVSTRPMTESERQEALAFGLSEEKPRRRGKRPDQVIETPEPVTTEDQPPPAS